MPKPIAVSAKAKHLAKRVAGGLVQAWAPGLVAVGLGLVVYAMAQSSLSVVEPVSAVTAIPRPSPSATAATSEPEPVVEALYSRRPELNERIGTITLPTLKLSWPIYEGTTNQQLDKGVGHYVNSVLPGIADNSVLSGHRTSVFNRIGELKIGDEIYVETSAGIFTYRVELTRVVKRTDRTVIVPTSTAILTLTTCWPFNHAGITTQAYIVTATLQ